MVEVKAVIGKNFGDEGKGQTVNLLCRGKNALVVRHNGGAQAGHTVEEGSFRFVFHQLGSGSYQGCPTYWAGTFLPDLLKLGEEMADYARAAAGDCSGLAEAVSGSRVTVSNPAAIAVPGSAAAPSPDFAANYQAISPWQEGSPDAHYRNNRRIRTIYADPDCACATVYDVLLNSLTELLRGKDKHGSCGMGIYETVLRTGKEPFSLRLRNLEGASPAEIAETLRHIRDNYTLPRLQALRDQYPGQFSRPDIRRWTELILDDNVLHNSARLMCENYRKYVTLADWPHMAARYHTIIFENGQGLMLDWDNEEYAPHLTASHTGMKNVARLLKELELEQDASDTLSRYSLEVIYVSRTYVTRHGAGRLDHECPGEAINPKMTDRTNVYNPWQDHLRYGKHPVGEEFFRYIRQDLEWIKRLLPHRPYSAALYLTHLDETRGNVICSDGEVAFEEFCRRCGEWIVL